MDVYPPHESIHTWKDFWIHLGTITIGLVIALALEAGAEWLHHLHQRHELETELRQEGLKNRDIAEMDFKVFSVQRAWLLTLRSEVNTMRKSGGKIKLPFPSFPDIPGSALPSDAVWTTAKESSLVALLPRREAEVYARLYRQHDLLGDDVVVRNNAEDELNAFANRFDDADPSSNPDLSSMTVDELGQFSNLITKDVTLTNHLLVRIRHFRAANQAVLDGEASEEDMIKRIQQSK